MKRIGKYEIVKELGSGATSTVYLALDQFNNQQVALKSRVCVGTITVRVEDDLGVPVPGHPVLLYVSAGPLQSAVTAANGTFTFTELTCAGYGVIVLPRTGFTYVEARGLGYVDGIAITPGAAQTVVLKVKRVP